MHMQLLRVHSHSRQLRISWLVDRSALIVRVVLCWIVKCILITGGRGDHYWTRYLARSVGKGS